MAHRHKSTIGMQEPLEISLTTPEIAAAAVSTAFCAWYFLKKHWLANNVLGLAFAVQVILLHHCLDFQSMHLEVILVEPAKCFVYHTEAFLCWRPWLSLIDDGCHSCT